MGFFLGNQKPKPKPNAMLPYELSFAGRVIILCDSFLPWVGVIMMHDFDAVH